MNSLIPLYGVIALAGVLTVNFFRAAWRLGILRAFGRRRQLRWRTLLAGALAGCLPALGALMAMMMIPQGDAVAGGPLALQMAGGGLLMHVINDRLVDWGS